MDTRVFTFFLAASTFWAPLVFIDVLDLAQRYGKNTIWILILGFFGPFMSGISGFIWQLRRATKIDPFWTAFISLAGVWMLGAPLLVGITTFPIAGFSKMDFVRGMVVAMLTFPITTFSMSTFVGSLVSLMSYTLIFGFVCLVSGARLVMIFFKK